MESPQAKGVALEEISTIEPKTFAATAGHPRMVVGITHAQTCLVLQGRLGALRRAGFAVTLLSSPGELLIRTAEEEGVAAHPLAMLRGIAPFEDLRSFWQLWIFLMREKPLITDFSTPKAGLLGNLAAWFAGVPHRVYTLRGLKLESSGGWKRRILLWSERIAAHCAEVVLCNSDSLRAEARALQIAPERKLHLLGEGSSNGVDTERFSPGPSPVRKELGIPEDSPLIGFVGRLTRDKGVPELMAAFELILSREPDCWLLLVGWFDAADDALSLSVREHIARHPRILLTGFVDDPAPYYRAMDILILPTHREGFPNVVIEASACGVAVITTESTGARDAVLPEITGLVIPSGNAAAIAESAIALIRNAERRARFGRNGRAWVCEHFSRDQVLRLAVDFYRGLIAN